VLLVVLKDTLIAVCVTVIRALGMTAPEASRTVAVI
jgi:hypothetical protein